MKPKTYSSEAIVLFRKNYKEADRIIFLFSKKYGKLKLIAKGIRKIKSRKRGHLEVFSKLKFIASKTKAMDIITEAEIINDYNKIRNNLNKLTLAYYFCEVVEKITREDEAVDSVYFLLDNFLKKLEDESDLKKLRLKFVQQILLDMGYISELEQIKDMDIILDDILERKINSVRVGKKVLTS